MPGSRNSFGPLSRDHARRCCREHPAPALVLQRRDGVGVVAHRRRDPPAGGPREQPRQPLDQLMVGARGVEAGAVPAAARGRDLQPERPLLRHLDPPPEELAAGPGLAAPALADHRLDPLEELRMVGEQPARALARRRSPRRPRRGR